ncbi:MAG: hypothetical protein PHN42_05590 [Bacilli bacterium]|nr:hypothetical protein [Bacilli bacterium]
MKEMLKSKVMICFIVFMIGVGYINSEQIKMDNNSIQDSNLVVVNA